MSTLSARIAFTGLFVSVSVLDGGIDARSTTAAIGSGTGYRVRSADVVVVCPLTVGGSFEARTKELRGHVQLSLAEPGAIEGSLQVDLQTLETGIALRDRHMRDKYLEVEKGAEYAIATLEQIRVAHLDGKPSMTGTLLLHGQRRAIAGDLKLQNDGNRIKVQADFPLRVSDYQIAKASYLGVGVTDEVRVRVTLVAESP